VQPPPLPLPPLSPSSQPLPLCPCSLCCRRCPPPQCQAAAGAAAASDAATTATMPPLSLPSPDTALPLACC
jgi:hypothetical protein